MEENNQTENQVKIVKPEISLNKKLGNIKFEEAFDTTTLQKAEQVISKSTDDFKANTLEDYEKLKSIFAEANSGSIVADTYYSISSIAFSIKSRAGLGGMPLASEVANLMFKFCDIAAKTLPTDGYRALKVFYDSLGQILENKFPLTDDIKTAKLLKGLDEISKKFTS